MIHWLYTANVHILGADIYWREILGNLFGLASAILGMRRLVWTWPIGVIGNVMLFTVFVGSALGDQGGAPLWGQASRQVFFIVASVYGFSRWQQNRRSGSSAPAVRPRWATPSERALYLPGALLAVLVCWFVFRQVGAGFPVAWWYYLADSWIFVGSILATYAMARGWVDFWLCWIAVDLVGVPELLHAHYYPSALLYAIYGGFVIWGFTVWLRIARTEGSEFDGAVPRPDEIPA